MYSPTKQSLAGILDSDTGVVAVLVHINIQHHHFPLFQRNLEERTVSVVSRSFPLELENDHATVVPSGQEILLRVCREDPKAVILAPERLDAHALADVPYLRSGNS